MVKKSISSWLHDATLQLKEAGINSPRLDAEILLAHTLHKPRTYLHAHSDNYLSEHTQKVATARCALRRERVPVAYIIGHKEFYGRNFYVTPSVLIPRPESEDIIELLKTLPDITSLIDVGCGSGALGLTAKLEAPHLVVTLADISQPALDVAAINAQILQAEVNLIKSNLLETLEDAKFSVIVANLPYVDTSWETSPELHYEPSLALYAKEDGLALIAQLLPQAPQHLTSKGYLLLEADPVQHAEIIRKAKTYGLKHIKTVGYIILLQLE